MNGDPRGRIQRVGKQVVIEIVLHVLITAAEGVPAVFRHPHAGRLLGIAAPSKAVERQGVENVLVCQRLHGERLFEDASTALVIDQRVVHRLAAIDLGDAAAQLDGLRYLKVADLLTLSCARARIGRHGGCRLARALPKRVADQRQADRQQGQSKRTSAETPLTTHFMPLTTGRRRDRSWNHEFACGTSCTPDTWWPGCGTRARLALLRSCSPYGSEGKES